MFNLGQGPYYGLILCVIWVQSPYFGLTLCETYEENTLFGVVETTVYKIITRNSCWKLSGDLIGQAISRFQHINRFGIQIVV